jgi:hypothetical protein
MKINAPGGHLDQLLRQTRAHHAHLSSMADVKANMLLTMSSIVVTLAAPQVMKAGSQLPLIVLIIFSLITILLAAYAVMPKMPFLGGGAPQAPDVKSPHFNLLFFGDFTRLDYTQFEAEMETLLNDPSQVYEVQVREIYTLGTFLAKTKYHYLRLAYCTFILGILASVVTLLFTNGL